MPGPKRMTKEELQELNKKHYGMLKRATPGFFMTVAILIVVMVMHPPYLFMMSTFVLLNAAWLLYKLIYRGEGTFWFIAKSSIMLALYFTLLYYINYFFGARGWIGYFASIIVIAALIIWRRWKTFIEGKHTIERMIWGETLRERYEREKREKTRP